MCVCARVHAGMPAHVRVCIYLYANACVRRQPCSPDNLIKQINVKNGRNTGRKSAELCGFRPHVTVFWSVLGLYLTPVSFLPHHLSSSLTQSFFSLWLSSLNC